MEAFGFEVQHGATTLVARTLPDLTPARDEVVINIQAVGLNNRERMQRRGTIPGEFNVLGSDVAGTIAALGAGATDLTLGQRVLARTAGGDATQTTATLREVVPLPRTLNVERAAAMITPGITAYRAVNVFAELQPGQTVIVKGASGGVGLVILQLAKAKGAKVIGVASAANRDLVLAAGASEFIAYDTDQPSTVLAETGDIVFNAALDGVNGDQDVAMVRTGGQIVSVAHEAPASRKKVRFTHIHPGARPSDAEILSALVPQFADGLLTLPVGTLLPFPGGLRGGPRPAAKAAHRPDRGSNCCRLTPRKKRTHQTTGESAFECFRCYNVALSAAITTAAAANAPKATLPPPTGCATRSYARA